MTDQNIIKQLAIYDPRHLAEADFLSSFVGRQKELQYLLEQIKQSRGENKHHLLLFGSRGMGKTSMLRRIAIAICDDASLKQQWIPVNFREEQYNVRQLSFFWKNTADAVAEWCEQVGDVDHARLLDDAQESHADAETLWDLLQSVSQQHGARLLLLVDNLDLILLNLNEQDQWALRKVLSQPDGPMMIAATTTLIKELAQRDAPFYDYFQLQDLLPLSATELRSCLISIARARGEIGLPVITEINQQPARLQVLHNLTNGNPRTLFHIYQILESLNTPTDHKASSFMAVLESLLDSVTPLYKARTEELTPQQRQVLDTIALAWDPKNSAWIAEQTQLTASTLSPQLKRLRELGIIEEVKLANNKTGLQLHERFYNIWYLLRNGSRRGKQRLRFFTQFLMDWYSPVERQSLARGYLKTNRKHLEYGLALASAMDDDCLQRALMQDATLSAIQHNELLDDILSQELDPAIMGRRQQQQDVEKQLLKKGWEENQIAQFWQLLSTNLVLTEAERQKVVNAIESSTEQQLTDLLIYWDEQKIPYKEYFSNELLDKLKTKQQQGLVRDYQDINGFLAIAEQSDDRFILLFPLLQAPEQAIKILSETDIDECVKQLFKQAEKNNWCWNNLGNLLQYHLSRYDEAEQAYRKAIECDPNNLVLWNNLGNLLQYHLSRYDEAEQAYRQAIECDPEGSYPWNNLGYLLQYHLSRYDEAEQAYRQAIECDPKYSYAWNDLGSLLQYHLSRYDEAEQAYRQAIECNPKYSYAWNNLGCLLQDQLYRYDEAEQVYLKSLEIDKKNVAVSGNLCWLAIQQNQLNKASELYQQLHTYPKVGQDLLNTALTVSQDNFGDAWALLQTVLTGNDPKLWIDFRDDLLRLVRLFIQHDYGERLLEAMKKAGFSQKTAPFYHAIEASVYGEALLKNINPEMRNVADPMYRWINHKPGD